MANRPTCSPWLHARLGEQLGLSPRSSGRVGGLSAGAQRTRRSAKGVRLPGRGSRKRSSDSGSPCESGAARIVRSLPCRYPAISSDCSLVAGPVEIKRHHYLVRFGNPVRRAPVQDVLRRSSVQLNAFRVCRKSLLSGMSTSQALRARSWTIGSCRNYMVSTRGEIRITYGMG
jgi:hypothetical protein